MECALWPPGTYGCAFCRSGGNAQQLDRTVNLLPCSGKAIESSPQPVWLISLGSKSGRSAQQAPCLDSAPGLALQMGRAAGWDLCAHSTASKNAGCQDLGIGCCKPHYPPVPLAGPQWSSSADFLSHPCKVGPSGALSVCTVPAWERGCSVKV